MVVLDRPRDPRRMLESLRLSGVRSIDTVVALRGNRTDSDAVRAIRDRFGEVEVVAPPMHRIRGAHSVRAGDLISLPGIHVQVESSDPRLELVVSSDGESAGASLAAPDGG